MKENNISIGINAPPVDGEANKELIKYISNLLKLNQTDLRIERVSINTLDIFIYKTNLF